MIDEKKLIEDIHGYFRKDMEKYLPEDKGDVVVGEDLEKCKELLRLNKVIYDIIKNQPKVSEWIPCSERLPEESLRSVLGWDAYRKRCLFVTYRNGRWRFCNDEPVKILAWMPLPEPYREE